MNVITYWDGPKPALINVLHRLMQLYSQCQCPESDRQNYAFRCIMQKEFLSDKTRAIAAISKAFPQPFKPTSFTLIASTKLAACGSTATPW